MFDFSYLSGIGKIFIDLFAQYFIFVGGVFLLTDYLLKSWFLKRRIQPQAPSRKQMLSELRWTVVNYIGCSVFFYLAFRLGLIGAGRIYSEPNQYGYIWLGLSLPVLLLAGDAYYYWFHRLLHTPYFFKKIHCIHHTSTNPTALSFGTSHPLESILGQPWFILPLIMPIHGGIFAAYIAITKAVSLYFHIGYEVYPHQFKEKKILRWFGSGTDHNNHHQFQGVNYAIIFHHWDLWMKTSCRNRTRDSLIPSRSVFVD